MVLKWSYGMSVFTHPFYTKYQSALLVLVGILAGIGLSYVVQAQKRADSAALTEVRANSDAYHFINPLLFYKSQADTKYDYLKKSLTSYVNVAEKSGKADSVSVYFRDMNTGEWTGIDETDPYEPASMLKVTAMLAYLKRSVDNPGILSKQIYYTPTSHSEETYRVKDDLPAGYYSVNDMIEYMIKYSDNDALASLATDDDNHTAEIFNLFELPVPTSATTTDYMSARTYSRIFRVLYDSTYLPWDLSENALKLLSTTDFKVGLVAGVPEGTVVSHKFGERTIPSTDGKPAVRELHDCGIVYKVNKPYFLCVMTRGTDFTKLQTIISDISRSTYSQI